MNEKQTFINEFSDLDLDYVNVNRNKLLLLDTYLKNPKIYSNDNIKRYKKIYTWNYKFYIHLIGMGKDSELINGVPNFNDFVKLEEKDFLNFENRIHGISMFDHDNNGNRINYQDEIFGELTLTKHKYDKTMEGKEKYLEMNKYKFNLCFENCYDEVWSWDYVTEKIFSCFKSKVIPIYYGCYNIEERINPDFFIDFRKYVNDIKGLEDHINSITDEEFIERTEAAYSFGRRSKWGNIEKLKKLLRSDT